jgi:GNAT superfamily N-acetyltransferase
MSTVPFTIRAATPADAVVVARLNAGLFAEDSARHDPAVDQGWPEREGASYFAELLGSERAAGWLALDGGDDGPGAGFDDGAAPVGYAVARLAGPHDLRPVVRADLESIYVAPERRGHGVGAALVGAVAAWARERRAVELTVTAYAANAGAVAFYARHGFAPRSVILARPL